MINRCHKRCRHTTTDTAHRACAGYKRMAHYTVTVWRLLATSVRAAAQRSAAQPRAPSWPTNSCCCRRAHLSQFFCMLVKCAWHVGLQQTKGM
jgi:hypothetical protein